MALTLCIPSDDALYCSKFMKISLSVQGFRTHTVSILNIANQNKYEKKMVKLWFLSSAHCLIKLYICIKFHEIIDGRFKVIEWTRFSN